MDAHDFQSGFRRGVALFNAQQFWDAHEAWEDVWRLELGDRRRHLQGLIQLAAAFVKLQQGNPRGTLLLLAKVRQNLTGVPATAFGLRMDAVVEAAARWTAAAEGMLSAGSTFYDRATLPRLRYVDETSPGPIGLN